MSAMDIRPGRVSSRLRVMPGIPWKAIRVATFYLGILGIWKLVAEMEIWPSYTFPPPEDVFEDLKLNVQDGMLWHAIAATMERMAIGFSLSIVIGLVIGISMGSFKWVDETLGSLVLGLQSLPSVTWSSA